MTTSVDGAVRVGGSVPHGGRRAELVAALSDPERLAAALPHVDDLMAEDGGAFTATLRPALVLGEVPVVTRWEPAGPLAWDVEGRASEHRIALHCAVAVDDEAAHWSVICHTSGALRAMSQRTLGAILRAQAEAVLRAAAA